MPDKFCAVIISATSKDEAEKIADTLLKKRLVSGTMITNGQSRYWWQGKIAEKEYYDIQAFSLVQNKSRIIGEVEEISSEKCPIIAFFGMDGNEAFLNWIVAELNAPREALTFIGKVLRKERRKIRTV